MKYLWFGVYRLKLWFRHFFHHHHHLSFLQAESMILAKSLQTLSSFMALLYCLNISCLELTSGSFAVCTPLLSISETHTHHHHLNICLCLCVNVFITSLMVFCAISLLTSFIMCICVCASQRMLATLRCVWACVRYFSCIIACVWLSGAPCGLFFYFELPFPELLTSSSI